MMKFRKKPIVIEAVKVPYREYADLPLVFNEVPNWLQEAVSDGILRPEFRSEDYWYYIIKTIEGEMSGGPDDWIIRGVKGELYFCKPDIFEATYEPAE